jgi:hypothetical protein
MFPASGQPFGDSPPAAIRPGELLRRSLIESMTCNAKPEFSARAPGRAMFTQRHQGPTARFYFILVHPLDSTKAILYSVFVVAHRSDEMGKR